MKLLRIIVVAVGLALPCAAVADVHVVTDFGDEGGAGTLRSLVSAAVDGDIIVVPAGRVELAEGEALVIGVKLTILGAGPALTVIDGNNTSGVFRVMPPAAAAIAALTITGGNATADTSPSPPALQWLAGGGIDNRATLAVSNVVIENCVAEGGGGVSNFTASKMTMDGSTIRNNWTVGTTAAGGGIFNGGWMHIDTSTISGNQTTGTSASANGGGIENLGNLEITNSTISGNSATGNFGGGIYQVPTGTMSLVNVTISNNTVNSDRDGYAWGGGVANENSTPGAFATMNTIIAENRASGDDGPSPLDDPSPDCNGTLDSLGHNLIERTTKCTVTAVGGATGDILDRRARLLALGDNGGPTQTHALAINSPAIDAGDDGECPTVDQRGVARPVDGDRRRGAACDIGAFEYVPPGRR